MSSELKDRIQSDLKEARKGRDKIRTVLLTTTLSEIRNREIEKGAELDDQEVVEVLARAVKQRKESSDQMAAAGRSELAEKEDREAEMLSGYLPEPLAEEEVRQLVRDAIAGGADGIGPVMGRIMPRIKGRFDGREANRIVREELGTG